MYRSVEEYLDALKIEMKGIDSAIVQDALADAEEFLYIALEATDKIAEDVLPAIIEKYGTPEETASAYAEVERRTTFGLSGASTAKKKLLVQTFFFNLR